jgi:hypothetical protein
VLKTARIALLALVATLAVSAAGAQAATRMPIGFFDDVTFRYAPDRAENLQQAAATGASVIHTTASWPQIAPKRPANALNGDDPAYRLTDIDDLVANAARDGMRVMLDINGTPKWANGGKTPNVMPKKLGDLTAFARMLATRYNGRQNHGAVTLYSVWNEPNLELFLKPQFVGKKMVGPANYAKLFKAAYAGIKAGNPAAAVAIGETSARGRDKPLKGVSATIAPATFMKAVAKVKGLKFDAWAHHPYPTGPNLKPLQVVRYPNVTLGRLKQFEADMKKAFHRSVPVWITEYGHETKPGEPHGVSEATQAAYAKQALNFAKADPNVQMFIWFVFRDSKGNPWQSGLFRQNGAEKPAYSTFSAVAKLIDGTTATAKAGTSPRVKVYVPYLAYYSAAGTTVGMTYFVKDGAKNTGVAGQPTAPLGADQSVTFVPAFKVVKNHTYTISVTVNEPNGHTQARTAVVKGV